jgi:hypothetical protein
MFKRNSNNTMGYTRKSAIAEGPATGNHQQQQKCLPQSGVWMQARAVTQATTVTPATSNIKGTQD